MSVTRRDLSLNGCHFTVSNPSGRSFEFQTTLKLDPDGNGMYFVSYRTQNRWVYLGIFNIAHNSPKREGIVRLTKASSRMPLSHKAIEVFSWVAHQIIWCGTPSLPPGYKLVNHKPSVPDVITKPRAIKTYEQILRKELGDFGTGVFPEPPGASMLMEAMFSDNPILQNAVATTDGALYLGQVDPIPGLYFQEYVL